MLLAGIIISLNYLSFGAMNITRDPSTGAVSYREHFKLSSSVSDDQAFQMVQNWFTGTPAKFSNQNQTLPAASTSSEAEVEAAFNNARPLQSIDPASHRLAGRSVIKYYGGSKSSIHLMYIEYYVVIEIHGNDLSATIGQIKYHHYNTRNYQPQVIYNWQGGKPFDSSDRFDALLESVDSNQDIGKVNSFLNHDMARLMSDLKMNLTSGYVLAGM